MISILHIEDDDNDATIFREELKVSTLLHSIMNLSRADEARDFLEDESNQSPDLIILDWNLSDGEITANQFLSWLKENQVPRINSIPVVVLTGQRDRNVRRTAIINHANSVFHKDDMTQSEETNGTTRVPSSVQSLVHLLAIYWEVHQQQASLFGET